jgi:nucleoside-diphosphate-sugar epimerase
VLRLISDNRKARQGLDWAPAVSLRDGLAQTIAWVRQHPQAYQVDRFVR